VRSFEGQHPEIDYPCPWSYRIIGADEGALRRAVVDILGDAEYTLERANRSSGGAYCSLELELVVQDEAQRLRIFDEIARHPEVRFVL
jgi:putative lipoic acid-binding regulatory protein